LRQAGDGWRSAWPAAAAIAFGLLLARPAAAELRVRVSRSVTGRWESVGITVHDPRGGLDAKPGPLTVTMADNRDRRQSIFLEPGAHPGEWSGRFTPLTTGRFTGTAVLERKEEKDIGLVPLVRVTASHRRGFVHLHPHSRRALRYSDGGTLFPIGVRLTPDDLTAHSDWKAEIARLRAHDVNFVELPVPWMEERAAADAFQRSVDAFLVAAEQTGRLAVLLRLEAPADAATAGQTAYREHLERAVRRWSYSPAVAAWYVTAAGPDAPAAQRAELLRVVRAADAYHHLVAVPSDSPTPGAGADIGVGTWNWQRPANQFAFLEVPDRTAGPTPLPGESSWQMLVLGGVGLPLWPYRPGAPDALPFLQRIGRLAKVAGTVPYQTGAAPISGVIPVDTPGSFCRYGGVYVGWLSLDKKPSLLLPALPRGKYEVRTWDPGNDVHLSDALTWSSGERFEVPVPAGLPAAFLEVRPAHGGSAGSHSHSSARAAAHHAKPRPRPVRERAEPRSASRSRRSRHAERAAGRAAGRAERASRKNQRVAHEERSSRARGGRHSREASRKSSRSERHSHHKKSTSPKKKATSRGRHRRR
jgi:hypothetical protein